MPAVDMINGVDIISLNTGEYKVMYFHPTISLPGYKDQTVFDLTDLVTSLTWDYSRDRAAKHLSVSFQHHPNLRTILGGGGVIQLFGYAITPGNMVFDEIGRYFIIDDDFSTETDAPALTVTIDCYDAMWYLANNQHTEVFHDKKASDIITSLCTDFGIPIGQIDDTGAVLPRLFFRDSSLYDIIITALTESRYIDGQRFVIYSDKGKIYVKKKVLPAKVFVFEYGENMFKVSLGRTLSEMKNRIRLYSNQSSGMNTLTGIIDQAVDGASNDIAVLQAESNDTFMQGKYGLISEILTRITPDRYPTAQSYSDHLLLIKRRVGWKGNIEGPNVNTMKWGDAVYVYEPLTQFVGQYYIVDGKHTVTRDKSSMSITMYYEDMLPENYFEKFENAGTRDLMERILNQAGLPSLVTGQSYISPVIGQWPITQEFGDNISAIQPNEHIGIDIGVPESTTLYATNAGVVTHAGGGDGPGVIGSFAGNWVSIDHGGGILSIYAHMSSVGVLTGMKLN